MSRFSITHSVLLSLSLIWVNAQAAGSKPLEHDGDLTDADLFAAIDLDRPGLESARAAVNAHDAIAVRQALADYFASRTAPLGLYYDGDRPAPYKGFDRTAADQLAAGVNYARGKRQGLPRTGYLPHLVELADAYWWTGDPKYATSLAAHLQYVVREGPAVRRSHPLNTSVQVPNWIGAWQALRAAHEFTTDQRIDSLKGFLARARWLNENVVLEKGARTMNITWMIAASTAHLGIIFPEFKEAARWRERGMAGIELSLAQDIYPDGLEKELSSTYYGVYPQYLFGIAALAQKNGIKVDWLARPQIRELVRYLIYVMKPDGSIPMLNDSDTFLTQQRIGGGTVYLEQTGVRELEAIARNDPEHHNVSATPRRLLAIGADQFNDPEMAFVASGGSRGVAPASTSQAFTYGGQAFQRTGWKMDDLYLVFDAGPYGRAHQHEDKLSIDMMAYGRTLVADPGRYTYDVKDPFRSYFMSTASHSSVLVDGNGQRRSSLKDEYETEGPLRNFTWHSSSVFDDASGIYDSGYGAAHDKSVTHAREVFFAKRAGYWIITDRINGTRAATTQTQFQLTPGKWKQLQDRPALVFSVTPEQDRPAAGLWIDAGAGDSAVVTVAEGEESPIRGWYSPRMAYKYAAPMVVFNRSGALPRTNSTLLLPFAGSDAPEVRSTRVEATLAEGQPLSAGVASALHIERTNASDMFLSSSIPGTLVAFDRVRSDGSRAWLSRLPNGDIASFVLIRGSKIQIGGSIGVDLPAPMKQLSGYISGAVLYLEASDTLPRLRVAAPAGVTEIRLNGEQVGFVRHGAIIEAPMPLSTKSRAP